MSTKNITNAIPMAIKKACLEIEYISPKIKKDNKLDDKIIINLTFRFFM